MLGHGVLKVLRRDGPRKVAEVQGLGHSHSRSHPSRNIFWIAFGRETHGIRPYSANQRTAHQAANLPQYTPSRREMQPLICYFASAVRVAPPASLTRTPWAPVPGLQPGAHFEVGLGFRVAPEIGRAHV